MPPAVAQVAGAGPPIEQELAGTEAPQAVVPAQVVVAAQAVVPAHLVVVAQAVEAAQGADGRR